MKGYKESDLRNTKDYFAEGITHIKASFPSCNRNKYWAGKKVHSGFFHDILKKILNKLFGQPNAWQLEISQLKYQYLS